MSKKREKKKGMQAFSFKAKKRAATQLKRARKVSILKAGMK